LALANAVECSAPSTGADRSIESGARAIAEGTPGGIFGLKLPDIPM
jgi:hypothetical protein